MLFAEHEQNEQMHNEDSLADNNTSSSQQHMEAKPSCSTGSSSMSGTETESETQVKKAKMESTVTAEKEKEIADKFLPAIFQKEMEQCKEVLKDETVSMALDGWSNVHN